MKNFVKGLLLPVLFLFNILVHAQRPIMKFGEIDANDFSPVVYSLDSSASGIILFDAGSSIYEGDNHGGFSIIFKRHTRMKLLNRNSFDLATITIPLYASGFMEEEIQNLEAVAYNFENGKVEKSALSKSSIFKDRLNKYYTVRKFTLPNIKEGSIIEIKYSLKSPYERDLRPWTFQRSYPVLWSEYEVTIPSFYDFATIAQGNHPFTFDKVKSSYENYRISEPGATAASRSNMYSVNTATTNHLWAMKDIPALQEESFTTTTDNYMSKLEFQLSKISYPNMPVKDVRTNWVTVSNGLMNSSDFGESLTNVPGWINSEVKKLIPGASTDLGKAQKIFEFIRDNITCSDHNATHLSNGLKKVYQLKHGNVTDINLLLTAFMLGGGFTAHPVLLSTRTNGKALEMYPAMDKMNYVVCQVMIDNKTYLLDGSHAKLGFGQLPLDCYNGFARVIDKEIPALLDLSADSVKENKATSVFIINDDKGGLTGAFTENLGQFKTQQLREKIAKTSIADFFKELKKDFSVDIDMLNPSIDSLSIYEAPATVKFNFKFNTDEDIIYLNPVFENEYKENPFKAAERRYPVEMPYIMNENYILNMEIPKGYKVEEMPKSSRVKLNEDEGLFEYLLSKDEERIQVRSTLKLFKTTFDPEDYQNLRDFFGYIVKKHSEQIVFKKIN